MTFGLKIVTRDFLSLFIRTPVFAIGREMDGPGSGRHFIIDQAPHMGPRSYISATSNREDCAASELTISPDNARLSAFQLEWLIKRHSNNRNLAKAVDKYYSVRKGLTTT